MSHFAVLADSMTARRADNVRHQPYTPKQNTKQPGAAFFCQIWSRIEEERTHVPVFVRRQRGECERHEVEDGLTNLWAYVSW